MVNADWVSILNMGKKGHQKPNQTREVKHLRWNLFAKIVHGFYPLTILQKSSTVGMRLGTKHTSADGYEAIPVKLLH